MGGNQGQRLLIVTGSEPGESPSLVCVYMYICELTAGTCGGISPCMQPKAARSDKGNVMAEMAKLLVSRMHSYC